MANTYVVEDYLEGFASFLTVEDMDPRISSSAPYGAIVDLETMTLLAAGWYWNNDADDAIDMCQ